MKKKAKPRKPKPKKTALAELEGAEVKVVAEGEPEAANIRKHRLH